MCLYIGKKEGHIAKHDIVVYKKLNKRGDDKYITPCQGWPVKLGTTLVPDEKRPSISECGFKYSLSGGAIHAYLDPKTGDGGHTFKAIIPKGTKFWIQEDMNQVAARELKLTSEEVDPRGIEFDYTTFLEYGCADVRLKGGKRFSMTEDVDSTEVEGIYAYGDQCIAREISEYTKFSERRLERYPSEKFAYFGSLDEAMAHMGGKELSKILEESCSDSNLLALKFCREQGGYLPSEGELVKAMENLEAINITRRALGLKAIPYDWVWSSSVKNDEYVWVVRGGGNWDSFCWYWYFYCCYRIVVPFLGSLENG